MTSKPLVRRTLATLRSAEFGFFGVVVYTRVHTPRRCGQFCIAGDLDLTTSTSRPWRTSWLMVGMGNLFPFEVTCSGNLPAGGSRTPAHHQDREADTRDVRSRRKRGRSRRWRPTGRVHGSEPVRRADVVCGVKNVDVEAQQ